MNTREIKTKFISVFGKLKPKSDKHSASKSRSFYLAKMASLQAQHPCPQFVLIHLLKDYVLDCESKEKNSRFVNCLIDVENSILMDKTSDYVLSIIDKLNQHYLTLEKDELQVLFSVFFSLYQSYQMNLTGGLKAELEITDIYEDFFKNELNLMTLQAAHKHVRLFSRKMPENFLETRLIKEINEPVLVSLLKNIADKNTNIKTRAREMLMLAKDKVSENDRLLIADKLLSLMQGDAKSTYYTACILFPAYFAIFQETDKKRIIDFLCCVLKCDDLLHSAGLALVQLAKQKAKINMEEVTTYLIEKIKTSTTYCRYKALEVLLQLRQGSSDCLPGFVVDTLKEYLSGHCPFFGIDRLKGYWQWLTKMEKENIANHLFQHCESDELEHKNQILKHLINLGHRWLPSENHRPVFIRLFECLHIEQYQETAMQALNRCCANIPLDQQVIFVNYLLPIFEKMNKKRMNHSIRTFCYAMMALAKLHCAIPENSRRWVVENSLALLRSPNSVKEEWACKSIVELVDIIPEDLHMPLVNLLTKKLNQIDGLEVNGFIYTSHAANEAARALCCLERVLKAEEKQSIAMQLFNIICDSKVSHTGRQASIQALFPYLGSLDNHQRVGMLNRLMELKNKTSELLGLFLHLHKIYMIEMEGAFLSRAIAVAQKDLDIYVPPELVDHIRSFMR